MNILDIAPSHEIIPNLHLGSMYAGWDVHYLQQNGFRSVLQVCPSLKGTPRIPVNIERWVIPVDDVPQTDLFKFFSYTTHWIHHQLRSGRKTLVHCMAGVSRSATTLGAYLMARYKWSTAQTIAFMRQKRWVVNPNPGFMKQLTMWEQYLQMHPSLYLSP